MNRAKTFLLRARRDLLFGTSVVIAGVLVGLLALVVVDQRQGRIDADQRAHEAVTAAQDRITRASERIDGLQAENRDLATQLGVASEQRRVLTEQLLEAGVTPLAP